MTVLLDRNYASYSAQFLEDLFRVLIDPVCGDKWPTLLALINRLLRDNPSLATSIPEQVTSWCMNRLGNDHVINLLQVCLSSLDFRSRQLLSKTIVVCAACSTRLAAVAHRDDGGSSRFDFLGNRSV